MPWPFDVAGQVYVSMAVFLSLSFYKLSMISLYLFGVYAGLICFKCASKINTTLVWTDVRINMANNFIFCNIFCLLSWRSSCRPRCFWTFLLLLALVCGVGGVWWGMLTFLCLAHMLDSTGCMPREEDCVIKQIHRWRLMLVELAQLNTATHFFAVLHT